MLITTATGRALRRVWQGLTRGGSVFVVAMSLLAADPTAELATLNQKYEEGAGSYAERFAAVKPAFEDFARRQGGTEAALEARLFLLRNTWWEREKGTMNASAATLVDEIFRLHPQSPQLGKLIEYAYVFSTEKKRAVFEQLLQGAPQPAVRAEALFGLARMELRQTDDAGRAQARARFAELTEKYGTLKRRGVTPYAELAEAYLSPHPAAALAPGQPAPEITGFDLDGKPLKLSTYRGKVVVIDFWGDW